MATDDLQAGQSTAESGAAEIARLTAELAASRAREAVLLNELTATADVLRVIATSPNDTQRVLDIIVETATRLCDGDFALIQQRVGEHLLVRAAFGWRGAESPGGTQIS